MTRPNKTVKEIRCLVFRSTDEDSKWSAVALELDIWGFGNSRDEAMVDLDELIKTQFEFASSKSGSPKVLNHPADKKWFKLSEELEKLDNRAVIKKSFAQQEKKKIPASSTSKNDAPCLFKIAA